MCTVYVTVTVQDKATKDFQEQSSNVGEVVATGTGALWAAWT